MKIKLKSNQNKKGKFTIKSTCVYAYIVMNGFSMVLGLKHMASI